MGRFKEISYEISEEIKKRKDEMEDDEVLKILSDIRNDSEFYIEGKSKAEDKVYIDEIAAMDKAMEVYSNDMQREEKSNILGLTVIIETILLIFMVGVILTSKDKFQNELNNIVEIRQNDLYASKQYIKENNELKRQYEELEKKYNYAVEVIRTTDKYEMPKELE